MAFEKEEQNAGAGFPPEYTAPSEQLQPGSHDSDNYAETTHYSKGARITNWIGRNVSGASAQLDSTQTNGRKVPLI